jgi:hypothetical protein
MFESSSRSEYRSSCCPSHRSQYVPVNRPAGKMSHLGNFESNRYILRITKLRQVFGRVHQQEFVAVCRTIRSDLELAQGRTEVAAKQSPSAAIFAGIKGMELLESVEADIVMMRVYDARHVVRANALLSDDATGDLGPAIVDLHNLHQLGAGISLSWRINVCLNLDCLTTTPSLSNVVVPSDDANGSGSLRLMVVVDSMNSAFRLASGS